MKLLTLNEYSDGINDNHKFNAANVKLPNGTYKGSQKVYNVYIDSHDYGFKSNTGIKGPGWWPVEIIVTDSYAEVKMLK